MIKDVYTNEDIVEWNKNEAIKLEPGSNEILVYTEKDGSIIIKINDATVGTIRNPELKKGWCGVTRGVGFEDVQNNTPITAEYKFKEFQY